MHDRPPSAPAADSAALGAALGFAARLRRAGKIGWQAAGRGVVEFYKSENLTFAASIAYYALLSFFPFVFLVFSLLSRVVVYQGGQSAIELIQRALPSNFEFLTRQMQELATAPFELGVASTLLMLWSSMGVFGAVTSAVNHAWGVEKPLGYFKHKLVAFVMLLAAGLLLSIALLIIGAVQVVQANWFSEILYSVPGLQVLSGFVYRHFQTPAFILVVGLIYYFAPNAQVRLRDVWFGAILAGLLWSLAFEGFALVPARHPPERRRSGRRRDLVSGLGVPLGGHSSVRLRSDSRLRAAQKTPAAAGACGASARGLTPRYWLPRALKDFGQGL